MNLLQTRQSARNVKSYNLLQTRQSARNVKSYNLLQTRQSARNVKSYNIAREQWQDSHWGMNVGWGSLREIFGPNMDDIPIPVAARSKAYVCGRSPAEIVGSNPTGGHGYLSVVNVVYCQVEVSATSWSLVQRSPTDCGASLCVI